MPKYKIINFKAVIFIMGILLMIGGVFMLFGLPFSLYYKSGDAMALLASSGTTAFTGLLLWISTRNEKNRKISKREAYLIVGLSYFVMSLFGALPYLFSGAIPNFTNAFFETVSGFTTTGASTLNNIEGVPQGILFWRSLTQWMGGMGIILLTIAILPYFGIGGMELFVAEVPGPTKEKLHPRINETAKRLWYIYLSLTAILAIILYLEGMSFYDAINHALTTLSTGGYSTKNTSVAAFNSPLIEYTIIIFMFIAGMNFTLHYFAIKLKFRDIINNDEFRLYGSFVIFFAILITALITLNLFEPIEATFRGVLFTIVSLVTTTGFATVDYTQWFGLSSLFFFWLLFTGGMAGSTSGGIKVIRHLVLVKNGFIELRRMLHPRAIVPLRFNGHVVSESMVYHIQAFFIIYVLLFIFGSLILAAAGTHDGSMDLLTALSATATCLGNVGPGIGTVGPTDNFHHISAFGKWFLSLLMVIGRLEIFTIIIIFTPYFWKKT